MLVYETVAIVDIRDVTKSLKSVFIAGAPIMLYRLILSIFRRWQWALLQILHQD